MKDMFVIKPCRTGAAFQGTPNRCEKIDLIKAEAALKEKGYEIVLNTKNVLIVKSNYSISVFPSGRVLIKDIKDEKEACKQIEKIYKIIGIVSH